MFSAICETMFFSMGGEKRGKKVTENVYYFGETGMLDCNQYILVSNNGDLTLIDSGNGRSFKGLTEGMKSLGLDYKKIKKVIITHEHVDHICGIYQIKKEFGANMPKLYAYGNTAKCIINADENSIFPGNLGISAEMFGVKMEKLPCTELKDGEILDLNGFKLEVIWTPGHSEGSASFIENDKKIIFCGDTVFPGGSFGRYDFPGGSQKTLKESIKKLTEKKGLVWLCAGHMLFESDASAQIKMSLRNIDYF